MSAKMVDCKAKNTKSRLDAKYKIYHKEYDCKQLREQIEKHLKVSLIAVYTRGSSNSIESKGAEAKGGY